MDEPDNQTTEQRARSDQRQDTPNLSGGMHDTVTATGGVVTTVVNATGDVAEEIIHAAGRVGVTLADEVFNVIGTILGGATETVGCVFQGRRPARRTQDGGGRGEKTPQRTAEQDSRTGAI
jgi:hypothetical protein